VTALGDFYLYCAQSEVRVYVTFWIGEWMQEIYEVLNQTLQKFCILLIEPFYICTENCHKCKFVVIIYKFKAMGLINAKAKFFLLQ
jgi:hypothetical protein